ncbi:DHS-like NAD/FAD-binding domain-containing protein, partial [Linderina pennispora]
MKHIRLNDLSSSSETKENLESVQRAVLNSQRCIVITGAGISVSSGIPDFRSPDGLFQQLKQRYPQSVASGRDLFDATLFNDRDMVGLFYNFMGELRDLVSQASCTPTHKFIKRLDEQGKLLRCYTQNIDSLEKRIGLETAFQKPVENAESGATQAVLDKTFTKAVQLHGDLENVVCTICFTKYPFTEQLAEEFREGAPPPCPHCKEIETLRDLVGKRSIAAGVLRPDIVLYNECHPQGDVIGALSEFDLRRRPDLLIVIGTSLKIPGVKRMVKEMSRCVQSCTMRAKRAGAGKAIFINRDDPPKGWDSVFDFFIAGDSDDAV